jgi:hypothetical protein
MSLLVREDAQKKTATSKVHSEDSRAEDAENIVLLEPMIVIGEKRTPEFTAPRETAVAKVLRTGTIVQHVGKQTTVRLWTSGDAGVVLSFKW